MKTIKLIILLVGTLTIWGCASAPSKSERLFQVVSEADEDYEQGRWFQASIGYLKIIEAVPNDHYSWLRLGNTYLRLGHIDRAINTYTQALERDPKHAKTHFNLSIAYVLKSMEGLQFASENLRSNDPAQVLLNERIAALRNLVDQPTEVTLTRSRQVYQYANKQ